MAATFSIFKASTSTHDIYLDTVQDCLYSNALHLAHVGWFNAFATRHIDVDVFRKRYPDQKLRELCWQTYYADRFVLNDGRMSKCGLGMSPPTGRET